MPGTSKYALGKKNAARKIEITLPSWADDAETEHNKCLVRVPDPMALIGMGILDSMDSLTKLVGDKIGEIEAQGRPSAKQVEQIKTLAENKQALLDGVDLIDKVVEWMVIEPAVTRPVKRGPDGKPILGEDGKEIPLKASERDDSVLYTDEVDLDDRMFILNYAVGGTKDLEAFREGTQAVVDALATGDEVPVSPLAAPWGR